MSNTDTTLKRISVSNRHGRKAMYKTIKAASLVPQTPETSIWLPAHQSRRETDGEGCGRKVRRLKSEGRASVDTSVTTGNHDVYPGGLCARPEASNWKCKISIGTSCGLALCVERHDPRCIPPGQPLLDATRTEDMQPLLWRALRGLDVLDASS